MNQPSIYKDVGARLVSEVLGFDLQKNADAIWFYFGSTDDFCRNFDKVLMPCGPAEFFLLVEILPSEMNVKISDFQGAFGRLKLLGTNKIRTFRKKITQKAGGFFLDAAPIDCKEERHAYLRAVYNSAAGFVLGGGVGVSCGMEAALQKKTLGEFVLCLIDFYGFVGLFAEDNNGGRSIVCIGNSLADKVSVFYENQFKSPEELRELIRLYGHRLANRRIFERALGHSISHNS